MPKPKTELNKRLRQQRKEAGLVEFRVWVTPKMKKEIEKLLNETRTLVDNIIIL